MALAMSAAMYRIDGRCGLPSFVERGCRNQPRSMPPCKQRRQWSENRRGPYLIRYYILLQTKMHARSCRFIAAAHH